METTTKLTPGGIRKRMREVKNADWKVRYLFFKDKYNDDIPLSWMLALMSGLKKMEYYRATGISATTLIAWDKGKRLPGWTALQRAIKTTGISHKEVYDRQIRIFPALEHYKDRKSISMRLEAVTAESKIKDFETGPAENIVETVTPPVEIVTPESTVGCDTTSAPVSTGFPQDINKDAPVKDDWGEV